MFIKNDTTFEIIWYVITFILSQEIDLGTMKDKTLLHMLANMINIK